jgi:hypothetical protein
MKTEYKTTKILLSLIAGLLFIDLVSRAFSTKTATAANPTEYDIAFSETLSGGTTEAAKRSDSFVNDVLDPAARKGWRIKTLSVGGDDGRTRLYALMER